MPANDELTGLGHQFVEAPDGDERVDELERRHGAPLQRGHSAHAAADAAAALENHVGRDNAVRAG
jgi:hypothetical protein